MTLLAYLACSLILAAPQEDPNPRLSSVLTKAERKKLNHLAKNWVSAQMTWKAETKLAKRSRLLRARNRAKAALLKEWEKRAKAKKDPLAHLGDLLAIFEGVFPYRSQSASGEVKAINPRDQSINPYSLVVPKGYRPTSDYPGVLLVPGFNVKRGGWENPHDFFGSTWKGSGFASRAVFVMPRLGAEVDLDPVPDFSKPGQEDLEKSRIRAMLGPLGEAQRQYRLDRDRLILDCGRGASGFGLRMASYFPDRFAGVILRSPVKADGIRLDSLAGTSILLISSEETKDVCDSIVESLNRVQAGSCTVLRAKGKYPYGALAAEVSKWAETVKRDLFRTKVVLAPNYDQFKKGFWVVIKRAEPLENLAMKDRPRLVAEADREANRIKIEAKSITTFVLLLNDALLDLDKEFTIVVNGKAYTQKRRREFGTMTDLMLQRYDTGYLFTTTYPGSVPKSDAAAGSNGGSEGSK